MVFLLMLEYYFNHESPRRGETFVTRKITMGLAKIIHGKEKCIHFEYIYEDEVCTKIMLRCVGKFYNIKNLMILWLQQYSVKIFVKNVLGF